MFAARDRTIILAYYAAFLNRSVPASRSSPFPAFWPEMCDSCTFHGPRLRRGACAAVGVRSGRGWLGQRLQNPLFLQANTMVWTQRDGFFADFRRGGLAPPPGPKGHFFAENPSFHRKSAYSGEFSQNSLVLSKKALSSTFLEF